MASNASNESLAKARDAKDDEFYTQLPDIERELKHYRHHFKDKVIYCNCDDPRVSNFFHYFSHNYDKLGLKGLITTCYKNDNIDMFSRNETDEAVSLQYYGSSSASGVPSASDIGIQHLKGDGDFRSAECIELLQKADIVVTNPPFSKFKEYVSLLVDNDKQFLIIGSLNAITYKQIFRLIKDNHLWLGYGFANGNAYFSVPSGAQYASGVYDASTGLVKFRNVTWYTNLDIDKRHEKLVLFREYSPELHPTCDNYNAISVGRLRDIPYNYEGVMAVPITFLDKYNPDQFTILGSDYDVKEGLLPDIINPEWHGKLDRAYVHGKRLFARLLIQRVKD